MNLLCVIVLTCGMGEGYSPLGIQETPYQQQFVWQTTLGHIFPGGKGRVNTP